MREVASGQSPVASEPATGNRQPGTRRRGRVLVLIGIFRLTKAVFLIGAAFGVLKLMNPAVSLHVREWLEASVPASAHHFVLPLFATLSHLTRQKVELASVALFAYAALFLTEGVGLILEKVWAEYLTIVATASFIPFEIYEIVKKVTIIRMTMLALNVAILLYLVWRRSTARRHEA